MKMRLGFAIFEIVVLIILAGWIWFPAEEFIFIPGISSAATSSAVTVTATVGAVISCSTNVASTDFGALTSGSISTASPNASTTMSCANSGAGCTLSVNDAGSGSQPGLWNSGSSHLVASPNGAFSSTATLAAGTEGYGIQAATTTVGSGGTLGIASKYLQTGNVVGGLATTTVTLASSTAAVTSREIVVTHKAAISATTTGGSYADTITYSCLAN